MTECSAPLKNATLHSVEGYENAHFTAAEVVGMHAPPHWCNQWVLHAAHGQEEKWLNP